MTCPLTAQPTRSEGWCHHCLPLCLTNYENPRSVLTSAVKNIRDTANRNRLLMDWAEVMLVFILGAVCHPDMTLYWLTWMVQQECG